MPSPPSLPGPSAGGAGTGEAAADGASPGSSAGETADSGDTGQTGDAGQTGDTGALPGKGSQTPEERAESLDGELGDSLSKFDRLLLREKQILAEKRAASTTGGAGGTTGGAAGASAAGGSMGGGESGGGESGGGESEQGEGGQGSAKSSGAETTGNSPGAAIGDERVESGPQGETEGNDGESSRVPSDIPDSRGDDIVARQLREAAMNEPDPELREKLWDEYRRYKGISGKKAGTKKKQDDESKAKEVGGESSTG